MNFSQILKKGQRKTDIPQKILANRLHITKSSMSNYLNGYNVPADVAIDLANEFKDYDTSSAIAYEMFGILKTFDGDRFGKDALSTDAFAEYESHQADEIYVKKSIRKLIADNHITIDEQASVDKYIDEELDDVLMRISRLVAISSLRHKTLMDVFKTRMKYYVRQHYMIRDNLSKAQRLTLERK